MSEVTYQSNKEMSGVLEYLQTVTPVSEVWGIEVADESEFGNAVSQRAGISLPPSMGHWWEMAPC